MDISLPSLDTKTLAETGVIVPLKNLDGTPAKNSKGEAVTLTLVGVDSETYRKAARVQARQRVERARETGADISDEALDRAEAEALDMLVACTKDFAGFESSDGKAVKFSAEAVLFIYRNFPVVREQAGAAINDRTRFTLRSSNA